MVYDSIMKDPVISRRCTLKTSAPSNCRFLQAGTDMDRTERCKLSSLVHVLVRDSNAAATYHDAQDQISRRWLIAEGPQRCNWIQGALAPSHEALSIVQERRETTSGQRNCMQEEEMVVSLQGFIIVKIWTRVNPTS